MKSKKTSAGKTVPPVSNDKEVKMGYNEKNPTQPQGAFKPDSATSPRKVPLKKIKGKG